MDTADRAAEKQNWNLGFDLSTGHY